jgi:hypothetical protein
MPLTRYKPGFAYGTRALFGKQGHLRNGQYCTIFAALPNPSQRPENQWYDVRFEDQSVGRYRENCLQAVLANEKSTVA